MALATLDGLRVTRWPSGEPIGVRIGIASGPVVAGVIGRRKFAYDLWGDKVNTASRLESHGSPGHIQVTDAVHECLRDRCDFTDMHVVDLKGKGPTPRPVLAGSSRGAAEATIDETARARMNVVVGLVAVVLMLSVACAGSSAEDLPSRPPSTVSFEGSDAVLYVDVASTSEDKRRGLMGVEELPTDQGMAFAWEEPVDSTFWMKDTLIPLSIAFVDEEGRVITIREMKPCTGDPCPTYAASGPYVLAIEANAGWFERHDVGVGDRAELRVSAYG
jgi:uncharacterized membrane protein (UPF0127 family)